MLRCRRRRLRHLHRAEEGRQTTIADVLRRPRSPISPVTARRPLPSLFVTAVTVIIYRRSLPPRQSSCRDVVVRRSRVAEISTTRRLYSHNIVGVRTGERCCLAIRFVWTATVATARRPPNARWPFYRCACTTGPTWTYPTITRAGRRRRPAVSPRPVRPRPPRRPTGRGETRPTCTGERAPGGVPCEGRTLRHRPKYVPVNRIILYSVGVELKNGKKADPIYLCICVCGICNANVDIHIILI